MLSSPIDVLKIRMIRKHNIRMPNYCFNSLRVEGEEADIKKFIAENKGEHPNSITFTKSIPVPTDPSPENPRDWTEKNWGTTRDIDSKYNTSQWVSPKQYDIQFESAWTPPDAWVKYVSILYDTLKFSLFYDEPNCRFRGNLVVLNGRILQETCEEDYESSDDDEDEESQPDSVS